MLYYIIHRAKFMAIYTVEGFLFPKAHPSADADSVPSRPESDFQNSRQFNQRAERQTGTPYCVLSVDCFDLLKSNPSLYCVLSCYRADSIEHRTVCLVRTLSFSNIIPFRWREI